MARTSLYDLADEGDKVVLKGTLVYSALRKMAKPNKETKYDKEPKYRITIADPEVVHGKDTKLGQHILDEDISHGKYKSQSGQYAGKDMWGFTSSSNAKKCPDIYTKETGSSHVPADKFLTNELAPGQEVEVLFSIYKSKSYDRKGGSLDGVMIQDPNNIQYFGAGNQVDYSDVFGANKGELKANPEASATNDSDNTSNDQNKDGNTSPENKKDQDVGDLFDDK